MDPKTVVIFKTKTAILKTESRPRTKSLFNPQDQDHDPHNKSTRKIDKRCLTITGVN